MATDPKLNSALNVMRRMPPSKIRFNVSALCNLMPDHVDELLQRIDQPLETAKDSSGKLYLKCDYNRDGDSYRSPWTNEFDPALDDGFKPSARLRAIEENANIIWDTYRAMYYEGGVSSVYLWALDSEDHFAACFIIKKEIIEPQRKVSAGNWDSIHIVEVKPAGAGKATYSVVSTVILTMTTEKGNAGSVLLSGSLTRQAKEKTWDVNNDIDHVINMGKTIEDIEIGIRGEIEGVYIQKTREVLSNIRRPPGANAGVKGAANMMSELGSRLKGQSVAGRGVALPGLGSKS